MRRRIVLIGHSPVSLFIARQLSEMLGSHIENQLIWFAGSSSMVNFPLMTTIVGRRPSVELRSLVDRFHLGTQPIARINLRERYLVLPKQIAKYDHLILDTSCQYRPEELEKFGQAAEQLFTHIKARRNQQRSVRARVVVEGNSVISYQLALLVRLDADRFGLNPDELRLEVERPTDESLKTFLSGQGLVFGSPSTLEQLTTVRFQAPQPQVKNSAIRGLPIDRYGEGKVMASHCLRDYPTVWYLGDRERHLVNLWQQSQKFAEQIAREVVYSLTEPAGPTSQRHHQPATAAFLTGSTENYLDYEGLGSGLATRQMVRWGEYRLWRRLERQSN